MLGHQVAARRLDAGCVQTVTQVVGRWLDAPDGYVELAEGLAGVFAKVADAYTGTRWHGLEIIADQWIVRYEDAETIRNWALSQSSRHGPDTWW